MCAYPEPRGMEAGLCRPSVLTGLVGAGEERCCLSLTPQKHEDKHDLGSRSGGWLKEASVWSGAKDPVWLPSCLLEQPD